ncbi:hypothetical protein LXL04_027243 [Taraxacum kok-saghyz]
MERSSNGLWYTLFNLVVCFISFSESVHLPGVASRDYQRGDHLQVKVNKLSSTKTRIPHEYYYLNYCKSKHVENSTETENSVYTFLMREEQPCKVACRVKLDAEFSKKFKEIIDDEYRVN